MPNLSQMITINNNKSKLGTNQVKKTEQVQTMVLDGIVLPSKNAKRKQGNTKDCFTIHSSRSQPTNFHVRCVPWRHHRQCHKTHDLVGEWKSWLKMLNFSVNKASFVVRKGLRKMSFWHKLLLCLHDPFKFQKYVARKQKENSWQGFCMSAEFSTFHLLGKHS